MANHLCHLERGEKKRKVGAVVDLVFGQEVRMQYLISAIMQAALAGSFADSPINFMSIGM